MSSTLIIRIVILAFVLLCPGTTNAADAGTGLPAFFDEAETIAGEVGLSTRNEKDFITDAIDILLSLAALLALAVLIYGGVVYITSVGDEEKASRGKRIILYAIIGLLFIGFSAVIVNVVIGTFGSGGGEDIPT